MIEKDIIYNHDETLFLQGLKHFHKQILSDKLSIYTIPAAIPTLKQQGNKTPNIIYERLRTSDLLSVISNKSIIIGTPYIGKSCFIYYYLLRVININNPIFKKLIVSHFNKENKPKIVISHTGNNITLYFLDEMLVYTYHTPPPTTTNNSNTTNSTSINKEEEEGYSIINYFDPKYILYFYNVKNSNENGHNSDLSPAITNTNNVDIINKNTNIIESYLNSYPIIITSSTYTINIQYIISKFQNLNDNNNNFRLFYYNLWTVDDLLILYNYTNNINNNNTNTSTSTNTNTNKKGHNYCRPIYDNNTSNNNVTTTTNNNNNNKICLDLIGIYGLTLRCLLSSYITDTNIQIIKQQIITYINSIDYNKLYNINNNSNYYYTLDPFIHRYIFHVDNIKLIQGTTANPRYV